jgi:membrane protease YdiL (CAAX protease family)
VTVQIKPFKLSAVQEAFGVWGTSFAAILLATATVPAYAKLVATVSFLYLPLLPINRRGEDYQHYGVTLRHWRQDIRLAALLFALVAPLYFAGYLALAELPHPLPAWLAWLAPHLPPYGADGSFKLRLPDRFELWALDQLLVVALPEEFFYRGYLQTRLRDAYPQGKVVFGARIGPAFLLVALLFAVGHLADFRGWRLAVFFPALLFGWLRERTGTILGSSLFHAACNLYELVLRASFYGAG